MSEESAMYEELDHWAYVIERLKKLAIEMESGEQDSAYISEAINSLFHSVGDFEPDDDGINERYLLDFEHPDNPSRKLVFEFYAYIKDEVLNDKP